MKNQNDNLDGYEGFIFKITWEFLNSIHGPVYNAVRSMQKLQNCWMKTPEEHIREKPLLPDIRTIEVLLIDIFQNLYFDGDDWCETFSRSVGKFLDTTETNIFKTLRSFQEMKNEWMENSEGMDDKKSILRNSYAIEKYLSNIAFAYAFKNRCTGNNQDRLRIEKQEKFFDWMDYWVD